MTVKSLRLGAMVLLLLAGCASTPDEVMPSQAAGISVQSEIAQAAKRIETQIAELSVAANGSKVVPVGVRPQKSAAMPSWLLTEIEIRWNGEPEPLLRSIVDRTGGSVELVVVGRKAAPILVSLEGNYAVVDALYNLGAQMGSRADVMISGNTITLRYGG